MAFQLMRKTGLRIGELSDLSFNPLVTHGDGYYFLRVKPQKFLIERLVPLGDDCVDLVKKIQERTKAKVKPEALVRVDRLLLSRESNPYAPGTLLMWFKKYTSDILDGDGQGITSHQLRHTYATELLNAGMSLLSIMKILGHRSPNMTLRYAQVTPNTLRDEYLKAVSKMRLTAPQINHKLVGFEEFDSEKTGAQL